MKTPEERAQIARENGAKSKGPKTAEGRRRISKANTKHGLYAANATVLEIESNDAFEFLRKAAIAQWNPRNAFENQYVEEIVDCSWRIARLRLAATHEINAGILRLRQTTTQPSIRYMDAVTKVEIDGSTPQGNQTMLQRRISALIFNRSMITAELRALKGVPVVEITQNLLITKEPVSTMTKPTAENIQ